MTNDQNEWDWRKSAKADELRDFMKKVFKPRKQGIANLDDEIIIDFIAKELLQDRKDTLESVRGWVEKEKKPSLKKCLMGINKSVENNTFMSGYNQAFDDLLTYLATLEHEAK